MTIVDRFVSGMVVTCASAAVVAVPEPTSAHPLGMTDVLVIFKTDGTYQIDVATDLDNLAEELAPIEDHAAWEARVRALTPAQLDAIAERVKATVSRRVRIRFDGASVDPAISLPHFIAPLPTGPLVSVLKDMVRLAGTVPADAKEFTFGLSRAFYTAQLTILDQGTASGIKYALGVSEDSPPYRLGQPSQAGDRAQIVAQYLLLGFEHILPLGVDHILFVLGLFLLSTRIRPLLWQVTAFTIAHSVTLGLSMYGVVSLPSRLVESFIALSITYVAVENLLTTELKPWRPAIVFGFGLLHGLGFAGVLRELGLPESEFASSLIAFNVGVEFGQLSVVLIAFLAVGWFRKKRWYRPAIVLPLSALIALIGFYWSVQRALFGPPG